MIQINDRFLISAPIGVIIPPKEAKRRLLEKYPELVGLTEPPREPIPWMHEVALVALGVKPFSSILFDMPYSERYFDPETVYLAKCAGAICSYCARKPMNVTEYIEAPDDDDENYNGEYEVTDSGPFGTIRVHGDDEDDGSPEGMMFSKYNLNDGQIWYRPENAHLAFIHDSLYEMRYFHSFQTEYGMLLFMNTDIAKWFMNFPSEFIYNIGQGIIYGYSRDSIIQYFSKPSFRFSLKEIEQCHDQLKEAFEHIRRVYHELE